MTRTSTWMGFVAPTGGSAVHQRAQDAGLCLEAHVADFVEEERAAIRALERPALFGGVPGGIPAMAPRR